MVGKAMDVRPLTDPPLWFRLGARVLGNRTAARVANSLLLCAHKVTGLRFGFLCWSSVSGFSVFRRY